MSNFITQPKLLPLFADGGNTMEAGNRLLTKKGGRDWHWLFGSDEPLDGWRVNTNAGNYIELTPFGYAKKFGGIYLKNPGGRFIPMSLDQMQKTADQNLFPRDFNSVEKARLEATADWSAFTSAASKYKRDTNLWLGIYMGGMEATYSAYSGDTPKSYEKRVLRLLAPILDIEPQIDWLGFDATMGQAYIPGHPHYSVIGGKNGGVARVVGRIQDMGITVAVEPVILKSARGWLGTCDVVMNSNYKDSRDSRYGRNWKLRNKQGVIEETIHPLDMPGASLMDTHSWGISQQAKERIIKEYQDEGYNVVWGYSRLPLSLL